MIAPNDQSLDTLRKNALMARLIEALEDGTDIGHYGRLTFCMVAAWLVDEETIVGALARDEDFTEDEARSMLKQVRDLGYSPPRPAKIRDWDSQQDFQMLPAELNPDDDANVYADLEFPDALYEQIRDYHDRN